MTEIRLEIPEEQIKYYEDVVDSTEFETIEEYLLYVIEQISLGEDHHEDSPQSMSDDVSDQLESLGYL